MPESAVECKPEHCTVDVWIIDLAALRAAGHSTSELSLEEQARASAFALAQAAQDFRLGRVFLRRLLAKALDCQSQDVPISSSKDGKPFVAGGPAFNLSHCKSLLVIAMARGKAPLEIGVDVECTVEDKDLSALAALCFSHAERRELERYSRGTQRQRAFTRGWTRKEAIVKALGVGLKAPLKDFDVSLDVGWSRGAGDAASPSLLHRSRLEGVLPGYCLLHDLGRHRDCELSIAVIQRDKGQPLAFTLHQIDDGHWPEDLPGQWHG